MIYINRLFFGFYNQIRKFYLNSKFYDKKISKIYSKDLIYKPSPHLLSSLIKYQKKKFKIEDFSLREIWNKDISHSEFKKLNSFYWFFSLDLKSSKKSVQSVITNWIKNNNKYNEKSWNNDLTAKRIEDCFFKALITGGPIVKLGTKCPSITSTCIMSAPAFSNLLISLPNSLKSADSIEGDICIFFIDY